MRIESENVSIQVERTGLHATLLAKGPIYGLRVRLTLPELEALAAELHREASAWRSTLPPDHYATLGLSRTASEEDVKSAYRTLVKQHHPDLKNGDEAMTKRLNEAYSVLADAQQRQAYDRTLT